MKQTLLLVSILFIFSMLLETPKANAYGSYRSSSFSSDGEGWLVMPQGIYYFNTINQNNGNNTVNRYVFDGSAGYHFQLLYLGAEYTFDQQQTSSNGNPTSTNTYKSYGAQIGIMSGGFQLLGTYYVGSAATDSGGTANAVDYVNGTGFQINVGYLFDIGSGFSVGPEFLYRSLTYTSRADGKAMTGNYNFTTFIPEAGVKYMF